MTSPLSHSPSTQAPSTVLPSLPAHTLAAEDYWTADQLRVMRGLELPTWFRPVTHEPATLVADILGANASDVLNVSDASNTSTPEAAISQTPVTQVPITAAKAVMPAYTLVQQHYPWFVVASEPLSEPAQRLWLNMLASVAKGADDAYILPVAQSLALDSDPFGALAQATVTHIQAQVQAMQPKCIFAMGALAAQMLLCVDSDMASMQGELHEFDGLPLIVLHHPNSLLKTPQLKAQAWRNLHLL